MADRHGVIADDPSLAVIRGAVAADHGPAEQCRVRGKRRVGWGAIVQDELVLEIVGGILLVGADGSSKEGQAVVERCASGEVGRELRGGRRGGGVGRAGDWGPEQKEERQPAGHRGGRVAAVPVVVVVAVVAVVVVVVP